MKKPARQSVYSFNTPWGHFELTVLGDKPWSAPWDDCGPVRSDQIKRWHELAEVAAASDEIEASVGFLKMARLCREHVEWERTRGALQGGRPKGWRPVTAVSKVADLYIELWMDNKIATQRQAIDEAIRLGIITEKQHTAEFEDAVRKTLNRLSKSG